MHFDSEQLLDGGISERRFTLAGVPGLLWTTPGSTGTSGSSPLILLGHPGDLDRMHPGLLGRAEACLRNGIAAAAIELPGSGSRPRVPFTDQARADLRQALAAGQPVGPDLIDRLVLPLVDQAVPEWQAALDALLTLPELRGPVGISGGVITIGVRLAAVEPRVRAAGLFAGSLVPRATIAEARQVSIPVHVLLQWDDPDNDRQATLDLFDAFGSQEKTLQANMGGHTGIPAFAGQDAGLFFARHLK